MVFEAKSKKTGRSIHLRKDQPIVFYCSIAGSSCYSSMRCVITPLPPRAWYWS